MVRGADLTPSPGSTALGRLAGRSWAGPALVFLAGVFLYSINLDRPPHPDELHHVLAAERLLETGRPIIAEGEYWRGIFHTYLVAISYAIFGDGLASARIPSVLLVSLVAPLVFWWVRREAGQMPAWIAGALFLSSPFVVEIAQFSRFYSGQLLFFTLGSICAFYSLDGGVLRWRAMLLAVAAVAMFGLASWLQETSLIGLVGVLAWAGGAVCLRFARASGRRRNARLWLAAAGLVAVAAVGSILFYDEVIWAVQRYRSSPLFAAESADEFWYYHIRYLILYPTLWPLTGLLALLAIARFPRLGWFATVVFAVSFLLTSFAAQKATRYFSYAQPYVVIVWSVGLSVAVPEAWRAIGASRARIADTIQASLGGFGYRIGTGVVTLSIVVLLAMNLFWLRSAALIANVPMPMEKPATNWPAARDALRPWMKDADMVVTTEELGAIYFLGRSDVRFSPSKFRELVPDQKFEFGIDFRTGRPIIAKPESLERLMVCFPKGAIVGPIEHWGHPILVNDDVQAVIRRHATPIELPARSHLYAWGWDHDADPPVWARCEELQRFSRRAAEQGPLPR